MCAKSASLSIQLVLRWTAMVLCSAILLCVTACADKPSASSDGDIAQETTKSAVSTETTKTTTTASQGDMTTATAGSTATDVDTAVTTKKTSAAGTTFGRFEVTTKTEQPLSHYDLKATDYILNPEIHKTIYFCDTEAYSHVQWQGPFVDSSYGLYTGGGGPKEVIKQHLRQYGFYVEKIFNTKGSNIVAEWGFGYLNLQPGEGGGLGVEQLPDVGFGKKKPKDRIEALAIIKDWFFRQYAAQISVEGGWDSCPGYYLFSHYGAEWGASSIGAEVCESINHTQASIAFTRGAARQFGLPYYIDISPWYNNITQAHSPSLLQRIAMAAHMGGSSFVMAENGGWGGLVEYPSYKLTKQGKLYQQVADFMVEYPDTGYAYTPFALVFDYYHGMYANERFAKKVFNYFNYEAGDHMSWELLDMFFPGGWESKFDETDYLINGPYGDTCDALLQNASQEVLNSYPCLILSGEIKFSAAEISRYVNYVKQGGTLIMNTVYLKQFVDYKSKYSGSGVKEITDGKGKVIIYGPDYDLTALDGIIKNQLAKLIPFKFSTQIEWLVKVKNGSMFVTLINNEGYSKTPTGTPKMDSSKTKNVTVTYTGNLKVKSIAEIFDNSKVTPTAKAVTITVKPGEIKVLEFKFD